MHLVLHVGAAKCGSSSIQTYLWENRRPLFQEHRCLYPCTAKADDWLHEDGLNQIDLFQRKSNVALERLRSLARFTKENGVETLILSYEGTLNTCFLDSMSKWIPELAPKGMTCIFYIRPQWEAIVAGYKQWGVKNPNFHGILDYQEEFNMDWQHQISAWAKVVGTENLSVNTLCRIKDRHLVRDFLSRFPNRINAPQRSPDANTSLPDAAAEWMRTNKTLFGSMTDNAVDNFLYHYKEHFDLTPQPGLFISSEEVQKLVEAYSESNQWVSDLFFDGDPLFAPPEPGAYENQKLQVESLAHLLLPILFQQHQKIEALEQQLNLHSPRWKRWLKRLLP